MWWCKVVSSSMSQPFIYKSTIVLLSIDDWYELLWRATCCSFAPLSAVVLNLPRAVHVIAVFFQPLSEMGLRLNFPPVSSNLAKKGDQLLNLFSRRGFFFCKLSFEPVPLFESHTTCMLWTNEIVTKENNLFQ